MPAMAVAAGWSALALTACKSTNPFLTNWTPNTDTVALYSTADSSHNLYDGFDFVDVTRAIIEGSHAMGTWDVAVGTDSTGLVWLPPGALGVSSAAGIAMTSGQAYDQVTSAPTDSSKYVRTPVPIVVGVTYVIRTRKVTDAYGSTCSHYGKVEPVDVDLALGRVLFIFDSNPNCGDFRLKP
jgi:hypothetical protein